MNAIALNIRKYRKKLNLTQKALADKVGAKLNTISNYETGISEPNIELILMFSQIFGITTDELLGISGSKSEYQNQKTDVSQIEEPQNNYTKMKKETDELVRQLEWLRQKVDEKDRLIEQLITGGNSAKKERIV